MSFSARLQRDTDNLERFLFADVCCQPNGLPLTVLSALARVGLDPWVEAKRLSQMPKSEAVICLASEIKPVLSEYRANEDDAELARSLVGKLPCGASVQPVDVSFAGNGFDGLAMIALMMGFFALVAVGFLAMFLDHL